MLSQLPELLGALPGGLRGAAARIFDVEAAVGRLAPPPDMLPWVERHFGDAAAVREQAVVTVLNRLTLEGALFNPLRARRPSGAAAGDEEIERWVASELEDDGFAAPLRGTPADTFGRVVGRHCVTASNIAKYGAWHGLVVLDEPHPLRFTREQIRDYLDVALRWVAAARAADPGATFPLITWNCMPKSGATVVHGHWQMVVARRIPFARPEAWRRAAAAYAAEPGGRGYFDDLAGVHEALGLGLGLPGVRAFAHLTPARTREVVLLSESAGPALADAIHAALAALVGRLGVRAFNMAVALPPLGGAPGWEGFPVVTRVGDRGPALTTRGDLGAMELYGTGVIADDPFEVAAKIRG